MECNCEGKVLCENCRIKRFESHFESSDSGYPIRAFERAEASKWLEFADFYGFEPNKSVMLIGGVGTGKTTAFVSKMKYDYCLSFRGTQLYTTTTDMINNIQNFETRKEFLELYKNVDMLYIDEFSYNFSSDIIEGLMFSIFDYRYNQRKRTNFATNRVSISCPRMGRRVREMVKGVTVNKEWREHLGV